jgi:hypothetical protein
MPRKSAGQLHLGGRDSIGHNASTRQYAEIVTFHIMCMSYILGIYD